MTNAPFNPNPSCQKCGSDDINRHYHKADPYSTFCFAVYKCPGGTGEHFLMSCRNCGYQWTEEVKP